MGSNGHKNYFGDKTRENRDALFNLGFLGHCLWRREPGLGRAGYPELGGEKKRKIHAICHLLLNW